MTHNAIVTPDFNTMPIGKLREYASHMNIALAKTAKKEEIKEAILRSLAGRTSAVIPDANGKTPPGHAKIILNEDPTPGSKNFPVYMNVNGYQCTIPRGKEVIVPMRIVRALNDAKVKRRVQQEYMDEYGRSINRETTVVVPSYPYQLLDSTPGPEPLTSLEAAKRRTMGPRKRYQQMFGRFPRGNDLNRAIEKGLIRVNEDEDLPSSAPVMLGIEDETTDE